MDKVITEFGAHWMMGTGVLTFLGVYTAFLVKLGFMAGQKSTAFITSDELVAYCDKHSEDYRKLVEPTAEQIRKDTANLTKFTKLVEDMHDALERVDESLADSKADRTAIRKEIVTMTEYVSTLHSSEGDTQTVLMYMVEKNYKDKDPEFVRLVERTLTEKKIGKAKILEQPFK